MTKNRKLPVRPHLKPYSAQRVIDTCYHEAGHIVAAVKFNLGILSGVKVSTHDRGTRQRGGRQVWGGRVLTERAGTLEQVAVFAQAGYTSEKRFNARPTDYDNLFQDELLFMEALGVEGEQYLSAWNEWMNSKTLPFVESNWRIIAAIAQGLIRQKHHTLSKQRVIRLYNSVTLRYPAEVAVHEAAHAVMFDALGEALERVSIESNTQFEGYTMLAGHENAGHAIAAGIPGALAGPAASVYLCGEALENFTSGKFRTDEERLISIFEQNADPAEKFEEYRAKIYQCLNDWVRPWVIARRPVIFRFAQQLESARTLEGEKLQSALSSAWMDVRRVSSKELKRRFIAFWESIKSR